MTLILRPASADDAPATHGMLSQLGYRACEEALRARLDRIYHAPDAEAIVATDGERLVGLVALELAAPAGSPCRLAALVVRGSSRRRGVGRILLAAAEAVACARGCAALEASCAQAAGRRFLRRSGFAGGPRAMVKRLD
jgi:GNAT superfamily N-acetyltransferase